MKKDKPHSRSEAAAARGFTAFAATHHHMNRRAVWHDYAGKGLYMITIVVKNRHQILGNLLGTPHPHVELTPLGWHILRSEFPKISTLHPNVKVWKVMIMPDHIHMILYVDEHFPDNTHLGTVIRGFKIGCSIAAEKIINHDGSALFEEGFNDKILLERDVLTRWRHYLDDNPRRLWLKRSHPDLFTTMHYREIAGTRCQLTGNLFLLDYPEKRAVIVHRAYDPTTVEKKKREWLGFASEGGVLVSAAIAEEEKKVCGEALDMGCRVIFLRDKGFPKIYKPSGRSFDACASGRLLQISPWEYTTQHEGLTRAKCLFLNHLAEAICTPSPGTGQ